MPAENKWLCFEWLVTMTFISTFWASKYSSVLVAVWVGAKTSNFPSPQHFLPSVLTLLNLWVLAAATDSPSAACAVLPWWAMLTPVARSQERGVWLCFLAKDAENLQSAHRKTLRVLQRGLPTPLHPCPLSPPLTTRSWRERKINTAKASRLLFSWRKKAKSWAIWNKWLHSRQSAWAAFFINNSSIIIFPPRVYHVHLYVYAAVTQPFSASLPLLCIPSGAAFKTHYRAEISDSAHSSCPAVVFCLSSPSRILYCWFPSQIKSSERQMPLLWVWNGFLQPKFQKRLTEISVPAVPDPCTFRSTKTPPTVTVLSHS